MNKALNEPLPLAGASRAMRTAARVLGTEAEALAHLSRNLPPDFDAVIDTIRAARGRVIVSGIGKSGPCGAQDRGDDGLDRNAGAVRPRGRGPAHGDLGMIAAGDVCLLISNSGETAELSDVVHHAKRFSIPLIGLSSEPGSTLMRAADLQLILPRWPEACAMGMVPTTSTTLALALGDALAVALMELRGFRPEDFGVFHPGGKLGAQLLRVGQLMHRGDAVPMVDRSTPMREVLLTMTSKGFGIAAIVGEGRLHGVITDGDLRRHIDRLMTSRAGGNRQPRAGDGDRGLPGPGGAGTDQPL